MKRIDVAIVGANVIGLAAGRALAMHRLAVGVLGLDCFAGARQEPQLV